MLIKLISFKNANVVTLRWIIQMSYKKKQLKKIETKTLSFLKSNSKKTFNYKQIASNFGINDTKGRNDIIKVLNILTIKNKIVE